MQNRDNFLLQILMQQQLSTEALTDSLKTYLKQEFEKETRTTHLIEKLRFIHHKKEEFQYAVHDLIQQQENKLKQQHLNY